MKEGKLGSCWGEEKEDEGWEGEGDLGCRVWEGERG